MTELQFSYGEDTMLEQPSSDDPESLTIREDDAPFDPD